MGLFEDRFINVTMIIIAYHNVILGMVNDIASRSIEQNPDT